MENTRRKEPPLWLNTSVNVWTTKNDIPVVNLRDVSETLSLRRSTLRVDETPQTPDEESFHAESPSSNSEKTPELSKQEYLNAILASMQGHRESQKTPPTLTPAVFSNAPASGATATTEHEPKTPSFPETKTTTTMEIEIVQGVNLPGEKKLTPSFQAQRDTLQTLPLFHDPVWGESGTTYDIDAFAPKEDEKIDIPPSLNFESLMVSAKRNEVPRTDTTSTMRAPPPPFTTAATSFGEMMYQPPAHPSVMASSSPQIAYPPGMGLGASAWATAAPPPGHGVAVQPFQVFGMPLSLMHQGAVMALPQAYRMPYQFYQMHPQATPITTLTHHQAAAFQTSPSPDPIQMGSQKLVNPQNPTPRPGTNVGAAPFIPGGKGM